MNSVDEIPEQKEKWKIARTDGKPLKWKKHHRWQYGWQVWLKVVDLIDRVWPRNP